MNTSAIGTGFLPALLFLVLAVATPDATAQEFSSRYHRFRVTVVADGLAHPWALAFLPDGDVRVAPDGSLWLLTDHDPGQVLRIDPLD